jgi:hypothetical protein
LFDLVVTFTATSCREIFGFDSNAMNTKVVETLIIPPIQEAMKSYLAQGESECKILLIIVDTKEASQLRSIVPFEAAQSTLLLTRILLFSSQQLITKIFLNCQVLLNRLTQRYVKLTEIILM